MNIFLPDAIGRRVPSKIFLYCLKKASFCIEKPSKNIILGPSVKGGCWAGGVNEVPARESTQIIRYAEFQTIAIRTATLKMMRSPETKKFEGKAQTKDVQNCWNQDGELRTGDSANVQSPILKLRSDQKSHSMATCSASSGSSWLIQPVR